MTGIPCLLILFTITRAASKLRSCMKAPPGQAVLRGSCVSISTQISWSGLPIMSTMRGMPRFMAIQDRLPRFPGAPEPVRRCSRHPQRLPGVRSFHAEMSRDTGDSVEGLHLGGLLRQTGRKNGGRTRTAFIMGRLAPVDEAFNKTALLRGYCQECRKASEAST